MVHIFLHISDNYPWWWPNCFVYSLSLDECFIFVTREKFNTGLISGSKGSVLLHDVKYFAQFPDYMRNQWVAIIKCDNCNSLKRRKW